MNTNTYEAVDQSKIELIDVENGSSVNDSDQKQKERPQLGKKLSSRLRIMDTGLDEVVKNMSDTSIKIPDDKITKVMSSLEDYIKLDTKSILNQLTTNPVTGISTTRAEMRLKTYGFNELVSKPPVSFLVRLASQFTDFLVILLIVAAIISAVFQHYAEFVAISLIIFANAYIGVVTEGKADDAVSALSSTTKTSCLVIRDNAMTQIDQKYIVPGDIMVLETGNSVCADGIIISSDDDFKVDEAQLTGESEPVKKGQKEKMRNNSEKYYNVVFKGTNVASGKATVVTIHTGMDTKMGTTASLINSSEEEPSPLQYKLEDLGKWLGIASIVMSIVVFVVGVTTGRGSDPNVNQPVWLQMLLIAVSLTVAAVPEGLPVCVTITLAMGMKSMAKMGSLVKNLKSVETLGSASVVCSDKTGTLTTGKMTAVKLFADNCEYVIDDNSFVPSTNEDHASDKSTEDTSNYVKTLCISYFCNSAEMVTDPETGLTKLGSGNTTDKALYTMVRKNTRIDSYVSSIEKEELKTFDSKVKMMACKVKDNGNIFNLNKVVGVSNTYALIKGAPNYVIEQCTSLSEEEKQTVNDKITEYSDGAHRVIAFAYKKLSESDDNLYNNLTFCGLVALIDPERPEVPNAIKHCKEALIDVKMITGDYLNTAVAIAKNIGLIQNEKYCIENDCIMKNGKYIAIDCKKLLQADQQTKKKMIIECNVFARALPEQKIEIVSILQDEGNVVAMTGDGVNDAPALKKANIGVGMGITGTETAKAAADMILTDDSFASIYKSVREGRRIYSCISKFVFFLLTTNPAEVFLILISTLLGLQSALTPVQILWLNLTTDSFSALALACEPLEEYIMHVKPRAKDASMINLYMLVSVIYHTIILTVVTLGSYIFALNYFGGKWNCNDDEEAIRKAQTVTIYVIVFSELLRSFTCRSLKYSSFTLPFFSNKYVPLAFFGAVGSTIFIGSVPGLKDVFEMSHLDGKSWGCLIAVSFIPAIFDELFKIVSLVIDLEKICS